MNTQKFACQVCFAGHMQINPATFSLCARRAWDQRGHLESSAAFRITRAALLNEPLNTFLS